MDEEYRKANRDLLIDSCNKEAKIRFLREEWRREGISPFAKMIGKILDDFYEKKPLWNDRGVEEFLLISKNTVQSWRSDESIPFHRSLLSLIELIKKDSESSLEEFYNLDCLELSAITQHSKGFKGSLASYTLQRRQESVDYALSMMPFLDQKHLIELVIKEAECMRFD